MGSTGTHSLAPMIYQEVVPKQRCDVDCLVEFQTPLFNIDLCVALFARHLVSFPSAAFLSLSSSALLPLCSTVAAGSPVRHVLWHGTRSQLLPYRLPFSFVMPIKSSLVPDFLGQTLNGGRLRLERVLGAGAYGVCYAAQSLDKGGPKEFAVKALLKTGLDEHQQMFQRRECELHGQASPHPGILFVTLACFPHADSHL